MKRGLYRAEAVVLNSLDYSESDRILTFYTLEHGKIRGIAKGARRSKKRFVGNLDPTSHINLIFFHSEKSELMRVEEAHLIDGFNNLKVDIDKLSQACYLIELVSEMTREGQAAPQVLHLLVNFLKMLDDGGEDCLLRFFEIRLLAILGYLPHLSGCVTCRQPLSADSKAYFSSEKGGAVCKKCSFGAGSVIPISLGTAGFLSMAAKFDTAKLGRLKPNAVFLEESERILYDFIKHQIGKELKTKKFLDKMRNASL